MDINEKRIAQALGVSEAPDVNKANLLKYRIFLLDCLDKNTILVGREDFRWEEKYVFGYGDPAEYKRLKNNKPSYKDEYKLIDITEEGTQDNDLLADVVRLSDKKFFYIGLSWLKAQDAQSKDFQTLNDFAFWAVNW